MSNSPESSDDYMGFENREDFNTAVIYHNDNIMEQIISHIPRIQDRLKLDRVSPRLQQLTRQADWVTSRQSLIICHDDYTMSIFLGSFVRKISVYYGGSKKLMDVLKKLLIVKKAVRNVIFGDKDFWFHDRNNATSILSLEFIQYLDNFRNLRNFALKRTRISTEAIEFLASSACQFKNRIKNLDLSHSSCSSWMSHLINEGLQSLTLGKLDVSTTPMICNRLNELKLHLERIEVEVIDTQSFGHVQDLLSKLSYRCTKFQISFFNTFRITRSIHLWTNINSLTIKYENVSNFEDMSATFENIKYLEHLEYLTISTKINESALEILMNVIRSLAKLKYLNLIDLGLKKNVSKFFENLPLSLEEIWLDNFAWDDEAIDKLCERPFRCLKKLTVWRPKRADRKCLFEKLINRFQGLQMFHFDGKISCDLVTLIINLPLLDDVMINVWNEVPMEMVDALQRKFSVYRYNPGKGYIELHLSKGQYCPKTLSTWSRI